MFSKKDSLELKQLFWTSFGKAYPRKWIKYHTKIKHFSFKFLFDNKKAIVCLDIEHKNLEERTFYLHKMQSLQKLFTNDYIPDIIYDENYTLESGKEIVRIYLQLDHVCIHNKNTWEETMLFFNEKMSKFEEFFIEYEDVINPQPYL